MQSLLVNVEKYSDTILVSLFIGSVMALPQIHRRYDLLVYSRLPESHFLSKIFPENRDKSLFGNWRFPERRLPERRFLERDTESNC